MKLDSLNKSSQTSGATVARDVETLKARIEEKRSQLDKARTDLQQLMLRKQQFQASNAELEGMVEQMRG